MRSGTGGRSELLLKRVRLLFIDWWSKCGAEASRARCQAGLQFFAGKAR